MKTQRHLSVNIRGFLRNMEGKSIAGLMNDEGRRLTDSEARKELARLQSLGHTLICASDDCEGFDPFGGGCPGHQIYDLTLHVKKEYFDQIKSGEKQWEYRLDNEYWEKRLSCRKYENLIICLGYPKKDDTERRLIFPYKSYIRTKITHKHFGAEPVNVFAIYINHEERIQ